MVARPRDWLKQAERDLVHARHSLAAETYEWACFACQQAAEKAVKAVYQHMDRHYIPARYPNAHPQGAPYEFYARADAERAVCHAEQIIGRCATLLAG